MSRTSNQGGKVRTEVYPVSTTVLGDSFVEYHEVRRSGVVPSLRLKARKGSTLASVYHSSNLASEKPTFHEVGRYLNGRATSRASDPELESLLYQVSLSDMPGCVKDALGLTKSKQKQLEAAFSHLDKFFQAG